MKKPCLLFFLLLVPCFAFAQNQSVKMYTFGHSLIDHRPPMIATPSDETTVPHWLYLLAQAAGHTYSSTGQYGFLPGHVNSLPPDANWGYDIVPPAWDQDNETFAEANFSHILITARNFGQYLPPDVDFEDGSNTNAVEATEALIDYLDAQGDNPRVYLYENWPEMTQNLVSSFPPTAAEYAAYSAFTQNDFDAWWRDYQDLLLASRPATNVRMIPVGPILADIINSAPFNQISYTEFYEDPDPHGRATLYFLASMITYMAIFEEQTPANYLVPSIVRQEVKDNYSDLRTSIWASLNAFNTPTGDSRVFFNSLPVELTAFTATPEKTSVQLNWTTETEIDHEVFQVQHSADGIHFQAIGDVLTTGHQERGQDYTFIHQAPLSTTNYYRLRMVDIVGSATFSPVVTALIPSAEVLGQPFPNPVATNQLIHIPVLSAHVRRIQFRAFSVTGKVVAANQIFLEEGQNLLPLMLDDLSPGLYQLELKVGEGVMYRKVVVR